MDISSLQVWRGFEGLYLHVDPTNEAAVKLYEKEGFKRCGKSWKPGWEGAAASISYYRLGLK